MKLKVYDSGNSLAVGRSGKPTISFSKKGQIRLSKKLVDNLELKEGLLIEFAQDEENPTDWFFKVGETGSGIPLRKYKEDGTLSMNSAKICVDLLESINAEKACIPAAIEPEGGGWHALFTSAIK